MIIYKELYIFILIYFLKILNILFYNKLYFYIIFGINIIINF
jgi:hypothetical protein